MPGTSRSQWTKPYLDLLDGLLKPDDPYFRATDQFVVQAFSDPGTEAKEKNPVVGPSALSELVSKAPDFPAPGGGATWMVHGLDLDRALATKAAGDSGAVITWLFTDNENNWGGSQDDRGFYQKLRDDPDFRYVYFFPIADPERPGDSLVLYMLVHKTGDDPPWIDGLVADVERRLGAAAILYRPLYTNTKGGLDLAHDLKYNDQDVGVEGNGLVLYLKEGDSLDGQLSLKFRSLLKGWKINQAELTGESTFTVPSGYRDLSDSAKVGWHFSPSTLTVEPQSTSKDYTLTPSGDTLRFDRTTGELLSSPTADYCPEVQGHLVLTARIDLRKSQIEALTDPKVKKHLQFVHDLDKISAFMVWQADQQGNQKASFRTLTIDRPLIIRVQADAMGKVLVGLGALLVVVLGTVVGLALFAWKSHYTLEGPNGSEPVDLPWASGVRLLMDPRGVVQGKLVQRFGTLSVRPETGVTVNGEAREAALPVSSGDVRFETRLEQEDVQHWVVSRRDAHSHHGAQDGPTL
jgi:hypothetical protein